MTACADCGAEMAERRVALEYAESLVPDVILQGISERTCACGNRESEIPKVEELHELILKLRPRRSGALRFAMRDGKWTDV
jgi:hypothetical protein